MNIFIDTRHNFTAVMRHYLDMRMKFRGNVVKDLESSEQQVRCPIDAKPTKH